MSLKTPISTIGLSSEVLMKKGIVEDPERLNKYASLIYHENQRLRSQVDKVSPVSQPGQRADRAQSGEPRYP